MIRTVHWSCAWLGAALLASAAHAATPAAPAAQAGLPALPSPAADWARLHKDIDLQTVSATHDLMRALYSEGELVQDCPSQLPKVDAALAKVPVVVSLWQAASDCARQGSDEARAAHYDEGVARLSAHAMSRDSMAPGARPIAVLNADDIAAIVQATGMEEQYRYIDWERFGHHYPIVIVLWDEESKVERHLAFDFLDTVAQLRSGEPSQAYPLYRAQLREEIIKSQAKDGDILAREVLAMRAANGKTGDARVAALRATATDSGMTSLARWLLVCDGKATDCAEGAVDALLPLAEADLALYRVQLALAHARGTGVKRDPSAALALLDSAEARAPGRAVAYYAELWGELEPAAPLPEAVRQRLDRAASAGSTAALAQQFAIALRAVDDDADGKLPPAALELARKFATAGSGTARFSLYSHYDEAGDDAAAMDWIRRSAEAGDADGMRFLAYELMSGEKGTRDLRAGLDWMRRAALAGSSEAMEWIGSRAFDGERWAEAEQWFQSALLYGSEDSATALASLYSKPREGVAAFDPKRAPTLFKLVHENFDSPQARRAHAEFLATGTPPDPVGARALLEPDAKAGDVQSQVMLANYLMRGRLGPADAKAGLSWFEKAMAKDPSAGDSYAFHLYYRDRTPEGRAKAVAIERKLVAGGDEAAANNLAWWQCASPDAAVRSPKEGLKTAAVMGAPEGLSWQWLDTLAACHAANGDFARAAQLQAQVVAEGELLQVSPKLGRELLARLEGYRAKRPYVEVPEDEDPE